MNPPLRLAHVAARLSVAGMENVVASLVRNMPADRYKSEVWCLEEADVLGLALRSEGYEVLELGRKSQRDLSLFFRLASLVRKRKIDVLHCHDELGWFYGAIGALLSMRPRVVVTMHGRRPGISKRHLLEQSILASLTSAIVTVSSYLRQQITAEIRVSPTKVSVIRNGVSVNALGPEPESRDQARRVLGLPLDAFVIGCVGRLEAVKNLDLLLDAAAEVRGAVPSLCVVFIGDGSQRQRLTEKVASLGLRDNVIFAGIRENVPELLPALDVYICSSDYEGISLSILEAMAAARPVIATAVGGNTEILKHNETGILIEKGNPKALAQAILELSRDADRRLRLRQNARSAAVDNFSLSRVIFDYDRLYQSL